MGTDNLEVRLFWDDLLIAVETFPLEPGLRVEASSEPGAAFLLPSSLCPEPVVIARGTAELRPRQEVGPLTFVAEVHQREKRGPRFALDAALLPAILAALALHAMMLVLGGSSPRPRSLSLDDVPTVFAIDTFASPPVRGDIGGTARGAASRARGVSATRPTSARSTAERRARPPRAEGPGAPRGGTEVMLAGLARGFAMPSLASAYDASRAGANAAGLGRLANELATIGGGAGRPGVPCRNEPCEGGARSVGVSLGIGLGSGYGSGSGSFRGRDGHSLPLLRCGGTCGSETTGMLTREVVRRTLRGHRNAITSCYERELRARPDLSGRVETTFMITAEGSVRSVEATSEAIPGAAACIAQALERITFPESDGPTGVRYPFVFSVSE
jgi:hypothetical protein